MGTGTFLPPNECWHFVTNANPLFYIPSPTIDRFVESKARRESKATFNAALFASLQTDALVESCLSPFAICSWPPDAIW